MAATNKPATDIAYLCRALKAPSLAKAIDRLAERARAESWTHEEFLAACLEREVAARQSNGGELRIRAARFPARKTLEDFDFDHQRSLKRDVIAHLGALDFVDARDNVVFLGPPGTGKTHLAIGLSIRACQAGHRVAFATAAEWVDRFAAAHGTGRLHNELRRHGRYPLLVIDEVGYIPFETDAANLFWPDLEERAAANNLRVTMTYLLRVLEPARSAGEPAYHIRVDGQAVTLVTSDWLRIDADRFNEHVTRAARAESDGTRRWPSNRTWPPSPFTGARPTRVLPTPTGLRSSASTSASALWPRPPGPASSWSLVATWTKQNAWPDVPSRSTPGPRTPTPCWSRWRWPAATAPPPAAPSTAGWRR
jgi:DNA replication protein DnaC